MSAEHVTAFFRQSGFDAATAALIAARFEAKTFEKGAFFLKEKQVCRHLALVESGLFQHFVLTQEGEEKTTYMASDNQFLTALSSFLNATPSLEYIRCVIDARIWQIDRAALRQLLDDVVGFKAFYIHLLEYQITCIDNSRFDFITLNAQQRYDKMLAEEPDKLQKIPLQYLASILGVTPRHLSRIRRK